MQPKVAILLPTFNGEKYLSAQLQSLLDQSHHEFVVVIRDDGSSDGTVNLLAEFQNKYPDIFHLLESDGENLGPKAGFSLLMSYTLAHRKELKMNHAYLSFCDQDDVWHRDKIKTQLALLLSVEARYGPEVPVLVHSDLRVVNDSGVVLADSFLDYQGLNAIDNKFAQVLVSNKVTGCATMVNEALARKSLPMPDGAIMHDWWLGLVCSAFGQTGFISQPLLDYRQHGENTIGATPYVRPKIIDLARLKKVFDNTPVALHHEVASQAADFLACYGQELSLLKVAKLRMAMVLKSSSGILQRVFFRFLRIL